MVILALDTTTREGSVAVRRDGQLLVVRSGDPQRTHGERLPGDLLAALEEAQLALSAVDRFAVASGPGSFTGLRVGLATMQGLALSRDREVVGVPTLEAMAHEALWSLASGERSPALIIPWMNAHRGEVFSAIYEVRDESRLTARRSAAVGSPEEVLDEWLAEVRDAACLVIGDAVEDVRHRLEVGLTVTQLVEHMPLLAPVVARLGEKAGEGGATRPHAVRPVYVRRPDAELARERRQQLR